MLKTLRRAFSIEDIRKKLFYTLMMLIVVRLGSQLPTPGVNPTYIQNFFANQTGDAFNFFDAFTGGSFTNFSVFALSITPYITSSIIIQLLTIAIPKLEEMQKEGADGRKKLAAITRYTTVAIALIESTAMAVGFGRQGLLVEYNFVNAAIVVCTLTAGSAFLMWIGERITEKGVGNGISIVLLINIISRVPEDLVRLYTQFIQGKTVAKGILAGAIIVAILLVVVVFVIVLQGGERRIAVQYSQKIQGRKTYGGQSSHIPLKVNTAGVIPVIFASSLMQTPIIIAQFLGKGNGTGIGSQILRGLNSNNWCDPDNLIYSIGLVFYIILTIFFAYFYTSITFNPLEIANNMKKSGGFIPGIRPGKPTTEYLTQILNYIIFIGACGLVIVQVIPFFFNGVFGANVSFGGTSLIIIVGVVLETIKQIESQMLVRNYTGFLNNKGNSMKNSFLGY
jgi:preprotein translocase subunit SecY